ncbi:hypothetical protein HJD18_16995 [Thermoleophilia bacterium SCSIO 60948]|nr:hypothetical protein HJD18_16995 [Thermoleophilia bacterium SCSIO 60948]
MGTVRESIEIDASPQAVWDVVMDPSRLGDWVSAHEDLIDPPSSEVGPGDEFTQRLKVAGQKFKITWHLESADEPNLADWTAKGPARSTAKVTYRFEESGDGTRFDYINEFHPPGGKLNVAASLVGGPPAGRAARKSLKNLKALLEG